MLLLAVSRLPKYDAPWYIARVQGQVCCSLGMSLSPSLRLLLCGISAAHSLPVFFNPASLR